MQITETGRELKVGVIGLGGRGQGQLSLIHGMADVKVVAVCDVYEDRMKKGMEIAPGSVGFQDYKEILKMPEVEAVFIFTDWASHIPIAIESMRAGKEVAMEVGGANSIDECWDMVHTAEETGKKCMLLENCCYNLEEMNLMNMIRQGVFGDVVHCQGAYSHDLRSEIGNGDIDRHYRQQHFLHRNGELYPTHELGPIAQYLRLGRGNRMVSLSAFSSKPKGLHQWLQKNRPGTALADAQVNEGDVVTTMITCANGETIMLTHDCTLPRPYSRGGVIRGTNGLWMEDKRSIFIEGRTMEDKQPEGEAWESDAKWMKAYEHPLWTAYEEFGKRGGHGGMDYLVIRAFVESVQNNTPCPIDVYDTASLMCVTTLSEDSIANGGAPVAVPDFTNGQWMFDHGDKGEGIYAI